MNNPENTPETVTGRHYFYKGHIYIVTSKVKLKIESGEWVVGVVYRRADRDAENKNESYVRSEKQFADKFNIVEIKGDLIH